MSSLPITPQPETPVDAVGVLVVDDQLAVREGLARLISCASLPLRCVTTASNGAEALSEAARMHPDVVVLDVDLAGEDGLALIPELRKTAGVLVLTSHGDSATRARARSLGASAFIEKHQPAAELLGSIADLGHLRMRGEQAPRTPGSSSQADVGTPSAAPRQTLS
ncbi:MAG TPA: response regulator transcription factor [Burkholderiaceae bacterium]|nr:response regulator transcription factor [Burkholderiaceae bacterium]